MRNPSPDAVRRAARAVLAVAPGAVMPDEIGVQEQRTLMLPAMEQTKGALMVIYGLTEEAAMALLRWYARQWNVSAQNIATALTNVAEPETMGEEAERRLDDLLTALSRDLPSAPPRAQAVTEQRPSKAPATLRTRVAGISEARDVPFCAAHLFEANAAERARRSTLGNQYWPGFTGELLEVLSRAWGGADAHGVTIVANCLDRPLAYANDSFLRMTGYPIEEVVGRNCRFLQGPATDPAKTAILRAAMDDHRDVKVVLRNYRRDGSMFWNEVCVSSVRHPATNQVSHFIGTQTELMDRVEFEHPMNRPA